MLPEKKCPLCGDPVEGRANKVYCSATCKLRAFRQQQTEPPLTEDNTLAPRSERTGSSRPAPRRQGDATALRYQANVRKAELAHELEMEKLRLAAQERAREHELRLRPTPQPPPVAQPPSQEEQRRAAQLVREAQEQRQRDQELDADYGRLTEEFLEMEEQQLPGREFEELLKAVKKHEAAYRKHSGIKDPEHPARERLENLHQMQRALRVPLEDLAEQGPGLFGPRLSAFRLKKVWRRELRDSLLGLA